MSENLKLKKAATVALRDFMGITLEETLLIVSDENKRDIGIALFESGKKLCSEVFYLEMTPRDVNGQEPPEQVAKMMRDVDVVVCPTTRSLTHTVARRRASELGVRVGTMPGITADTLIRCMSADYEKIIELTKHVAQQLDKVSEIHVKTELGTDITFPIKKRRIIQSTGVLRKIGESGNIPSGEVYLAPVEDEANGIVVFDASIASLGILSAPLTVEFVNGYAEKISGGPEARVLSRMLNKEGKDGRALAEFGIGTNYKAIVCGEILEDEKALGTIHFAFGNNIGMGGSYSVPLHIDGIVTKPTVYADGKIIMEEGKILFD